jgi:glycosyltransferase involved in cell wall biosynthesis
MLEKFTHRQLIACKLLYFIFLNNAYSYLEIAEKFKIPLVFELYPGGGFVINNASSDKKLKRICESPCFKKVIVTQKITYDYLIKNNLCTPDKIELIFGVVTPLEKLHSGFLTKHYGFSKDTLDICFVAHRYMRLGEDKGYDVFIEVAKKLCEKYDNIKFHVAGSFDETVVDITEIKDKITFYGILKGKSFDNFFIDKDIILSPNKPSLLAKGAFDGFPTGCCVDAGLSNTAIFCTDELHLNDGYFKNDEEIVIIPHNTDEIVKKIEYYYKNPATLKAIAENGCQRIKDLYSFDKQLAPRIALLKKEISTPFVYNAKDFARLSRIPRFPLANRPQIISFIIEIIKKFLPNRVIHIIQKLRKN